MVHSAKRARPHDTSHDTRCLKTTEQASIEKQSIHESPESLGGSKDRHKRERSDRKLGWLQEVEAMSPHMFTHTYASACLVFARARRSNVKQ